MKTTKNCSFGIFANVLIVLMVTNCALGDNVVSELYDSVTHQKPNTTNEVTIYTQANYWGLHWSIEVSNCTNVPEFFYKKASSINTYDNCVLLFSREECKGRHVKVAPGTDGHSRLTDVDFNNELASLKLCDDNWDDKSKPSHKKELVKALRARRNVGSSENDGASESGENDNSQEDDEENILQTFLRRLNSISRFQIDQNNDGPVAL